MANVVNRATFQIVRSAHTPDFDPSSWLVNPGGLAALVGAGGDQNPDFPVRYWKVVGTNLALMNAAERNAVDTNPARLTATRALRKQQLRQQATDYVAGRYDDQTQRAFAQLALRASGASLLRLNATHDWMKSVYAALSPVFASIDAASTVPAVLAANFDTSPFDATDPRTRLEDVTA